MFGRAAVLPDIVRQIRDAAPSPSGERLAFTALDRMWIASRDIFDNHPLAVNVANVAWGSWGYFNRLAWRGPTDEAKAAFEKP